MPLIPSFESRQARWSRKLSSLATSFFSHTKVLLYHRVTTLTSDPLRLSVSPEKFYAQLQWLKKKYSFITADELLDSLLNHKQIKGKTLLISFDDGYADNFHEALPILESLSLPAIFFITTSYLNTNQQLWWDELEQLILKNNDLPPEFVFPENTLRKENMVLSAGEADMLFQTLHDELKYSTFERRELILNTLRQIVPQENDNNTNRLMTYEELKKLNDSSYTTIGAHTVNHISLGMQELEIQQKELVGSKQELEKLTGSSVNYFSYPYGSTSDLSPITTQLAKKTGFKLSFTNYYGFAAVNTPPHKIPRILVRDWDNEELEQQINKSY